MGPPLLILHETWPPLTAFIHPLIMRFMIHQYRERDTCFWALESYKSIILAFSLVSDMHARCLTAFNCNNYNASMQCNRASCNFVSLYIMCRWGSTCMAMSHDSVSVQQANSLYILYGHPKLFRR